MKKTVMRSYAKLIVRVGANVQKGQINSLSGEYYYVTVQSQVKFQKTS